MKQEKQSYKQSEKQKYSLKSKTKTQHNTTQHNTTQHNTIHIKKTSDLVAIFLLIVVSLQTVERQT